MLRALVGLLLVANAAFFVWTQGWLDGVTGTRAHAEREPERLARQVHPDAVKLLSPAAASAALAAAAASAASAAQSARVACLEAGPFADARVAAAEQLLAALPAGSWSRLSTEHPGSYLVYMGKYAGREALLKKEDELRRRQLAFEPVASPPELEGGLSLGRYDSREAATAALATFAQQGVHTARVVTAAQPSTDHRLRIEHADAALAAKAAALNADALAGGFRPCGSER